MKPRLVFPVKGEQLHSEQFVNDGATTKRVAVI